MTTSVNRLVQIRRPTVDDMHTVVSKTPAEAYLAELGRRDHQMVIDVFEVVANCQGLTDWRLVQWEHITAADLPAILEQLRAKFTDPDDVLRAIAVIKGVTRCAWRQNLMSGHQLAEVARWKA
jgi:hypothetical protein